VDNRTLVKAAREVVNSNGWVKHPVFLVRWALIGLLLLIGVAALWGIIYNHKPALRVSGSVLARETASTGIKPAALQWPAGQPAAQSLQTAFASLFRQWGFPFQPEKNVSACEQAQAYGLRCLKGPGSLNELSRLDKPAVLRLLDEKSREYYGTLIALDERTATVVLANETQTVSVDELKKRWYGEYTVLWKHPMGYRSAVKPGYSGPEVAWIDRHLSLFEGKNPSAAKEQPYDGELVSRMKRFQIAEGLIPDGIVGPQTFIQLSNISGENGPALIKKSGGR
jgi:general secretion pathway protein A